MTMTLAEEIFLHTLKSALEEGCSDSEITELAQNALVMADIFEGEQKSHNAPRHF